MESNLIVWSLNQLKMGIWEDMRLLFGNTEVQNQWKYTLQVEFSSLRRLYLVVCISWSFHGCRICSLRHPWKYYKNTNSEKVRTLLAGYTFIGFALLCFQAVTSCPLRGLFSISWETFPFKFALFNNHNNNNKNNNIFIFTKFSKLYNPTSRNYNPKFKLLAV